MDEIRSRRGCRSGTLRGGCGDRPDGVIRTHTADTTAHVWQHLFESGEAPERLSHACMKLSGAQMCQRDVQLERPAAGSRLDRGR